MKKIILFLIVGLFLSLIFSGCEKAPFEPVEPPTDQFTATIYPEDYVAKVGDTVVIHGETTGDSAIVLTKEKEKISIVTRYVRPPEIPTGKWSFTFEFKVKYIGLNQVYFNFYKSYEGDESPRVINRNSDIYGEELPPPPEPPVILLLDSARVPYGTNYNIALIIQNALSASSDIPGFVGINGGIFPTSALTSDTTFHVSASNEVGTTVDSIIILVDAPPLPTPLLDAIVKYPWSNISAMYKCSEGDSWQDLIILPSWLATKFVYGADGQWRAYRYGNLIGSPCPYSIIESDSTLILGDLVFKINYLIDTVMVLEEQNSVDNASCDDGLAFQLGNYIATTLK